MGWGQLSEVQQRQVPDSALQSQQPQTVEKWLSWKGHGSTGQEVLNMRQQYAKGLLLSICVELFCRLKKIMEKKCVYSCYTETIISSRVLSFYTLKCIQFSTTWRQLCVIGIYSYVFIYGSIETQNLKLFSKYFNEDRCFLDFFFVIPQLMQSTQVNNYITTW